MPDRRQANKTRARVLRETADELLGGDIHPAVAAHRLRNMADAMENEAPAYIAATTTSDQPVT